MRLARLLWAAPLLAAGIAHASEALVSSWRAEWPRTDFTRHTVKLEEIESGGPRKDGIPAIDRPKFDSVEVAGRWLDPREPVIALQIGTRARAYPLSILIWHEIVNDTLGETPVAVTFCPLCYASLVFDRRSAGRTLDFGTTGKLRHSDLVMYDRQTHSWWQQFTGKAIVGRLAGEALREIASQIVPFGEYRAAHPGGQVLARATGYDRPYGRNPYRGYDRIDQSPFLFSGAPDRRLPPMERVIAVRSGGAQRVYPFTALARHGVVNDTVGGEPFVVLAREGTLSVLDEALIREARQVPSATAYSRRLGARVLEFVARDGKVYDRETDSQWNFLGQAVAGLLRGRRLAPAEGGVHFAFAWLAFHPGSEVWQGN